MFITCTGYRSGTIMMNGLGILVNGMTTKTAYASTDLDHLRVNICTLSLKLSSKNYYYYHCSSVLNLY